MTIFYSSFQPIWIKINCFKRFLWLLEYTIPLKYLMTQINLSNFCILRNKIIIHQKVYIYHLACIWKELMFIKTFLVSLESRIHYSIISWMLLLFISIVDSLHCLKNLRDLFVVCGNGVLNTNNSQCFHCNKNGLPLVCQTMIVFMCTVLGRIG